MYSTDNGPHMNSWPDAAMTPFRNEKNSNWEGAYRVPAHGPLAGQDQAGPGLERDGRPPRLAADLRRHRRRRRRQGPAARRAPRSAAATFKVHLDGDNLVPYLTGQAEKSPARVVPLHQRRPAADRPALRQLEVRLHGAASRGHAADLGRALHEPARSEDLQSADGSVRARGHHVEHLLRLAARPRLPARPGPGVRRASS